MNKGQRKHGEVINMFLKYLNERSGEYVLKGGTALLTCYGLDRFSEDIDLDGKEDNISGIIEGFCGLNAYTYRTAKDTDTVKRYMINYGNHSKPLKVEISFRKKEILSKSTAVINGILVYNIDALCLMKTNAYSSRDRIRDLYDLTFICNKYFDVLSVQTKELLRNAVAYKGIEQFDYIVKTQTDNLIDTSRLAEDFLNMYDRLGLMYDEKERQIMEENMEKPC